MLGQGHDEDPGPSRQGGTELTNTEVLEAEVADLRHEVEQLQGRIDVFQTNLDAISNIVQTLEPWVGPNGQLTVRLERSEQAILALIGDPHNPMSSAQRATAILTAIPTPAA